MMQYETDLIGQKMMLRLLEGSHMREQLAELIGDEQARKALMECSSACYELLYIARNALKAYITTALEEMRRNE